MPVSDVVRVESSESRRFSREGHVDMSMISLRIPTKYSGGRDYQEKIWDHASGSLLIEESGGVCTDMHGKPLDFSLGRFLMGNEGIVAAGKETHGRALEAVRRAVQEAKAAL